MIMFQPGLIREKQKDIQKGVQNQLKAQKERKVKKKSRTNN